MKLLFVHDHPFYKDANNVYSGGGLPKITWDKYLTVFSSINVIGRKSVSKKDKKTLSSGNPNVTFNLLNEYSSVKALFLNYKTINNILKVEIENSDFIIVRLPSVLGVIAARKAKKLKRKIIVEQVGNGREAFNTYGKTLYKVIAPFFDYLNKKIVKYADYVVYVTPKKLQRDYPTQQPNIDISNVIIKSIKSQKEINFDKFSEDIFKIGLIGGFDAKYKGQDVLLNAISMLESQIVNSIEIHLVGKGNYDWILEIAKKLGINDNIKFIGPLKSGDEIFNFLETLQLYVQPSLTEGLPRAMIEAMSVGCPVLASKVGGMPDVIQDMFLHDAKNAKKLSTQINYLYNNREVLVEASKNNLTAAKPFLKTNLEKKFANFYTKIINEK
ncbi:glycosyltransferase [Patiriisocius hiemis]|uniref:Glycosyltransferase family 4 protein n=1 Tax=Patiriisocius hiemis TaxID=3075604 RepID=A0ABU2YEM7_9FLAO|nr:glycosyltransferase family 4 protein [Constantimarinum sp. W242]MDT0556643.1 glycosyltransferase family 4 protein [Constantimarinum sp. W242]